MGAYYVNLIYLWNKKIVYYPLMCVKIICNIITLSTQVTCLHDKKCGFESHHLTSD